MKDQIRDGSAEEAMECKSMGENAIVSAEYIDGKLMDIRFQVNNKSA
jgi:hypothetical protein